MTRYLSVNDFNVGLALIYNRGFNYWLKFCFRCFNRRLLANEKQLSCGHGTNFDKQLSEYQNFVPCRNSMTFWGK